MPCNKPGQPPDERCLCMKQTKLKATCPHWEPSKTHRYYRCALWQSRREACTKKPKAGQTYDEMCRTLDDGQPCRFYMPPVPYRRQVDILRMKPDETVEQYQRRIKTEAQRKRRAREAELNERMKRKLRRGK